MGDKLIGECYTTGSATFNCITAGGADSASGGSGGSGMECMQLRSPPGPFHYLISEQAKSFVALQELQNEVGALLEFRDLVIETFPNLRCKMPPSPAVSGTRRDWEPGVRVRRKLAGGSGEPTRAKPQPSVQDSGFSTETSCGKDAHSSARRPLEDELWALLDVIQRKGVKIRDEVDVLRGELDERRTHSETAEDSFARALSNGCHSCDCDESRRLREERDALLALSVELEAEVATQRSGAISPVPQRVPTTPLGRLDGVLETPSRPPRVPTPNSRKFAAILQESNSVELQRHLLTSTVKTQVLVERLKAVAAQRADLLDKMERVREENDDLKFQLEEKSIELEGAKARLRMLDGKQKTPPNDNEVIDNLRSRESRDHNSMRDMEPLPIPDEPEARISETPRRERPSRIPLHTAAHKSVAPKPPARSSVPTTSSTISRDSVPYRSRSGDSPARPPSAHSCRSVTSARSRHSLTRSTRNDPPSNITTKKEQLGAGKKTSAVPVRRSVNNQRELHENKVRNRYFWNWFNFKDTGSS